MIHKQIHKHTHTHIPGTFPKLQLIISIKNKCKSHDNAVPCHKSDGTDLGYELLDGRICGRECGKRWVIELLAHLNNMEDTFYMHHEQNK